MGLFYPMQIIYQQVKNKHNEKWSTSKCFIKEARGQPSLAL